MATSSRLTEREVARLPSGLQDAAVAPDATGALVLGGLTQAGTSTAGILRLGPNGTARRIGRLPAALHDAAAVTLGGAVYLAGGGDGAAQHDEIVRIDPATGSVSAAGHLPTPASDLGAAVVGPNAYFVGGFTGTRWLDTVVRWRPGRPATVVGHLPVGIRYAAVASADGLVLVAGGSTPTAAGRAVYAFDPATRRVRRVGGLPAATTHAAAATVGGEVVIAGGRGSAIGSPTDRIVGVDPADGRVWTAGHLRVPRSDLAAAATNGRIFLVGGRSGSTTIVTIGALSARPGSPAQAAPAVDATTTPPRGTDVYAHDRAGMLSPAIRGVPLRIYVPNSKSNTVDVIDPNTYRVIRVFAVGALPQHVTPSWDLTRLYVLNDEGNSLTPIDPVTARPGRPIPVDDPYNMYFTPDGRFAIVVAERNSRLDFRDSHTMQLRHALAVPCRGVDHMDFTASGRQLFASCEFSGTMLVVDVASQRVLRTIPMAPGAMPQDVKLSPDGSVFYVADMMRGGLYVFDAHSYRRLGFLPTGRGAHGLYPSRDARVLYVSNREAGTISVVSFATRRVVRTWHLPGGGSPDMGGVSPDGRTLWLSGRYDGVVYAIDTRTGRLRARIRVGQGPHGLAVWPQPGRYSLGHTGIMR